MPPRLKSLELHGYKTFALRTVFEFPGMITAVVGPNGSGKSNIADALRWVLGEQSYLLLRGKKTEDMIFAGSEQRPRAGMASATITFDNTDGWLPVDFSEVAITRRAYRDGQNEYLLNNQRVRLREISELLAQCGLSERTYTVIGQGLVDAALALKPEDRRRLFEEAAGIGLYRSRKEESLQRLENTQRNLDRVQDILAEIEPRLAGLEKQARRVQEYERLKADLRLLLRDWYGYHWFKSQKELTRSLELLRLQENRLELAQQEQQQTSQSLVELRSHVQELRKLLDDLYSQSVQENEKLQKVSRESAVLIEREKSNLELQGSLEGDLVHLEEEVKSYQDDLQAAETERDQIRDEVIFNEHQVAEAMSILQEQKTKREVIEIELKRQREGIMQLDTNQVRLRAHRQEVEDRLSNLKNSLARLENEQQRNSVTLADRRGVLSDKEEVLKKFEDAVMHSEAGLQEQQRKIREQEEKKRTKLLQLQAEEAEKTRSQVQLSTLLQVEENLTGYPDGARNLLVAARQGKVKGIFQVLSQSMLVPSEYEVAVSAALGEFLDLVLIEESDPELILAFLETSSKDRVALLPMNWVKGHHSGIPAADQGCIGLASDLIQSESKFDQVIRVLLGNVLVVRDRDAALRIRIGLPENMTVVTLKGELFRADGLIMAGAAGRRGTIGRKRQKAELETKITQINKIIEEQSLDISNLETQIAGIRKVELSINTQLKAHLAKLDIGRKDFQTAQLACEQVESQVTWQIGQRVELEKQISRSLDELNHLDDNLTHIAEQLISSKEVERQINSRLALVSIDEHQIQVTHWETAFAVSKRGLQEAHKRIDERRKILEANQQRCLLLQTRLEATESFYEMMISEKQNYRELEKELTNHIRSLQEQIDPVAIDLSGTELKLEALQAVDTAAQQALNQAERYHAQAQIDFTRQREAVDSLRRRIEDDIGLVVLDYDTNVSGPNPLPFEGMVEQLPVVMEILPSIDESIARQRAQLRRMGAVNMEAQEEYNSVNERYKFLTTQVADLRKADSSLREVIAELDELMKRDFTKTFNEVASEFRHMFTRLFGGGTGRLVLFDEDNPQESGIDIEARLPGRREQGLSLLSGGERSLTAAALIFALLKVSPTPFCVMDEVDAMLDEANVGRFVGLLRELSNETQFIIITHNRNTVQAADIIYGVTMAQDSTSQLISLKLDEIKEEMIR